MGEPAMLKLRKVPGRVGSPAHCADRTAPQGTQRVGSPLLLLAIIFSVGCRLPDEIRVSAGVEQGEIDNDRPMSAFDTRSYGLYVTPVWYIGLTYEAMENLAALDVSKAGQLTLREHGGHSETVVNVQQEQEAEAASASEAEAETETNPAIDIRNDVESAEEPTAPEEAERPWWFPKPPTTLEGAFVWVIYIAGFCLFLFVVSKLGYILPFLKKKAE